MGLENRIVITYREDSVKIGVRGASGVFTLLCPDLKPLI